MLKLKTPESVAQNLFKRKLHFKKTTFLEHMSLTLDSPGKKMHHPGESRISRRIEGTRLFSSEYFELGDTGAVI